MKPVAKVVDAGGVAHFPKLQWSDANTSLETPIGTELYTADQLRQAKVEVLREAVTRLPSYNENHVILGRMADELEKK